MARLDCSYPRSAAALCASAVQAEILIATASPMAGAHSWGGEQFERGAGMAVEDLTPRAASSARMSSSSWATTSATPIRRWRSPASWSATVLFRGWAFVLALLERGLEGLRKAKFLHDSRVRPVRSSPTKVGRTCSGVRPRRPARGDGRRYLAEHWADKRSRFWMMVLTWARASPTAPAQVARARRQWPSTNLHPR